MKLDINEISLRKMKINQIIVFEEQKWEKTEEKART